MINIMGKLALKLLKHELQKETPEIRQYLITELNMLCDEFKGFLDKEIVTITGEIDAA